MSETPRRLLVTGGAGFLGRHVLRRLLDEGHTARALVRPGPQEALGEAVGVASASGLEVRPCRLDDRDALEEALAGIDVVLHLAAAKAGSVSAQVASTVLTSEALLEASAAAGVGRFVLVSSLGVLAAAGVPAGGVLDEDAPLEPHPERRDPYTFAKVRQEELAWRFHRERGVPLVVVRPGVIFGEGESLLSGRVGLRLFGVFLHLGGGMRLPVTYVENCADAVVRAGLAPGVEGRAFNIIDDDLPTSRAWLRRYRREVEPVRSLPVPFPLLRVLARLNAWYSARTNDHLPPVFTPYKVDSMWKGHRFPNVRARAGLGWAPRVGMAEALDRSLRAAAEKP